MEPNVMPAISRASFLRLAGATLLAAASGRATAREGTMLTRPIPSTGAALPVVGCGTWRTFDVGPSEAERAPLAEVLRILFEAGGSVIDSSPMYGAAEGVVGDLLTAMSAHDRAFIATKVWTRGRAEGIRQMERSFALLQRRRIELMQVHNLLDWRTHLATLRDWRRDGRIGLVGITHYTVGAHDELAAVMASETVDFVQLNYSIDDRAAERRLLPLAAERGIAVLVNQPFGGGGLLRGLIGKPLPGWAAEIDCSSWPQVLLKFILTHPAVTCVIPGTGRPQHMADNVRAGFGAMPDAAMRARMVADWEALRA
ncbi:MAG: aldo/keto reductase [Alphaproteobacteria bacterium]